ncbi:MAG: NUDIX hydrolase [Verrucomicrobia bacterium]|jgi:ADP-ribose pyrophosphatase|nr:NUDIX hydrolase [Verrucomicrobiota bacterium]
MIQPWKTKSTRQLESYRIVSVRSAVRTNPRTQEDQEFYIMDCPDWVNIIAITPNQEMVMVEQFRHGTNTVDLEIPGGVMDPEDNSAVVTGVRELREETGYEGVNARVIGEIAPNPAIMSNFCRTVLIDDCELKHSTEFDSGEDIQTKLVPLSKMDQLVQSGTIHHSLVVVAFYHYKLMKKL